MGSNSINCLESQIIEIEDDVIDLDETEKTPEEVIYEWDATVRKKFLSHSITDSLLVLEVIMKDYLQLLQEMSRSYEDNETLRKKVFYHINFLHSYYVELECCTPEIYLNLMEDILTLYCNLEIEVIRPIKRKDFVYHKYTKRIVNVAKRIIHVLTIYLLDRHDHILHVLIKMNTTKISDSCSDVLKILYTHFLTKVPALNLSDESFCRNYIVFQKWKEIRKMDDWEGMDKTLYKMFKRSPESIKENEILRQILMPPCTSTVDIVMNLFQSLRAISTAYFKHISAKTNYEIDNIDFNIDLGDDELLLPFEDDNDEEALLLKMYNEFEKNMMNLPSVTDSSDSGELGILRKCKEELDEDDEVQFIGDIIPPRPLLSFAISSDKQECEVNEVSNNTVEREDVQLPFIPSWASSTSNGNNLDLENVNAISRLHIGSPRTVIEADSNIQLETAESTTSIVVSTCSETVSSSTDTASSSTDIASTTPTAVSLESSTSSLIVATVSSTESTPVLCSISQVTACCDIANETNESEVPLVVNEIPVSILTNSSETVTEAITDIAPIDQRLENNNAQIQASNDKNDVYNAYGLTTPPFDVQTDEHITKPVEPRLYTDIGQNHLENYEKNSIPAQVGIARRKNCSYDDFGLTPPNDLDDHSNRLQEPMYADIVQKNSEKVVDKFSNFSEDGAAQENVESETDNQEDGLNGRVELEFEADDSIIAHIPQHDTDYDDSDDQLDISEVGLLDTDEEKSEQENKTNGTDQIDTGQKSILNSAPNIPVTADSEINDLPPATHNGNTILKPLVTSNRTNGQAKDSSPTKIMYTSSQKIKSIPLEKFSMFENNINSEWKTMKENHEFDDILSGPVSKVISVKQNSISERLDPFESNSKTVANSNSRSSSPTEMTSPAYEAIDDFRKYFSHSINGHVPPPPAQDTRIPPSILKKTNAPKKGDRRIMFHESTFDHSEERRPRSDGVLVPKRVRRDPKINLEARVVLERLSFIENKMKFLNNPPTLRIDYDKTTPHINENDVVRCVSPPRITLILPPSRNSSGKVKYFSHLKNKTVPEKPSCDVSEDTALNLTIPEPPNNPESEFSNSPKFLQDTDVVVEHALKETSVEVTPEVVERKSSLLCDNSNFYDINLAITNSNRVESVSNIESSSNTKEIFDESLIKLPTAVPETYDFEKNFKNEVFSKIDWQTLDDSDGETRLPLKKRKLSVASENVAEEQKKEEISYPATPMISIAEVEALHPRKLQNNTRPFKTPAERKEMPPLPVFYNVDNDPSPIITDQFNINNHTYNNPTINYHMNNVPVPFINIPCGSYYSLPPILVPFNNVSNFDQSKLNLQHETYVKKETKRRRRHQ